MTENTQPAGDRPVIYTQNGVQKAISEDEAMYMLDSIAEQDIQRALVHYHRLTQANPYAIRLLNAFYQRLLDLFMFEDLLQVTTERLASQPNCKVTFSRRLDALQHMFRHQELIESVKDVVAVNPNEPTLHNILGVYYTEVGNAKNAKACFDQALKLNPDFAPAHWHRADYSTAPQVDLDAVTQTIASSKLATPQAHFCHFAAYKLAEKTGQDAMAFEHLQIANGLKRRTFNYDLDAEIAIDNSAKEIFNTAYMQSLDPAPDAAVTPIFIMGMPRSGTTLVEQIIASHPDVAGGDEYTALSNAIKRVQMTSGERIPVNQWLSTRSKSDWAKIGNAYVHNMRFVRGDKTIVTDKNQFNHRSIGVIKASLPNAKVIVVDRAPMDVAFGCYRQLFGGQGAKFSYQFDEIAKMYASYNSLIQHWQTVTPEFVMRIQYEELVTRPNEIIAQVLAFCGLTDDPACYAPHQSSRVVKTLSAKQVRQPIFSHGIDRWKRYATQLSPLAEQLDHAGLL
ncbi:sulfotransferase family protein [Arenicella xantha]|uniref:Sulfotransferase family protein n=1 Tax=Arenicella xantha TaxID=644221 RepID=A0A395JTC8_9GAMM|nr:sulfotransferase [Arenicella xantha]RBP52828.1 sulfotransferase family protein [Arenicella xantha]